MDDDTTGEATEDDAGAAAEGAEKEEEKREEEKREEENGARDDEEKAQRVPNWRQYMNLYVERAELLGALDKFDRRKPPDLPKLPDVESTEELQPVDYPLNAFNLKYRSELPNRLNPEDKARIWRNMRSDPPVDMSGFEPDVAPEVSKTDSGRWPGVHPCAEFDPETERELKSFALPCVEDEEEDEVEEEAIENVLEDDYAKLKELGHARIPVACPNVRTLLRVDRAAGEQPGLVHGDYVIFGLRSKKRGDRFYANVCLQGSKGMHLLELHESRARAKSWKFCFYQAIVALLAKTQLRYKYAWSVNVDYIYDHAWMLFTHVGHINVTRRQKLDDVVVYNYKYSVEVELVQELKDVARIADVDWNYLEKSAKTMERMQRRELMHTKEQIGLEADAETREEQKPLPVHPATKRIEEWFDRLEVRHRNCIFRTTRFSLAFWRDGLFWYLYNPYRCDEFGLWKNEGYNCIVKFCSRDSLKRHLMLLLLRAYVYRTPDPAELSDRRKGKDGAAEGVKKATTKEKESADQGTKEEKRTNEEAKPDVFAVQIFQLIYHRTQLHNAKLLRRRAPESRVRSVKKKPKDDCGNDPLDLDVPCHEAGGAEGEDFEAIERSDWLKIYRVTWTRCQPSKRRTSRSAATAVDKARWHHFHVEEPRKLYSLWGEIHPRAEMFDAENRGKQTRACYLVCAGMTRIVAPEYWSPQTLDAVVVCGDKYYTLSRLERELSSTTRGRVDDREDRLTKSFDIGEMVFEGAILPPSTGRLYSRSANSLWKCLERLFRDHHFGILDCEDTCVCVFKFCGAYYACDAASVGPPLFRYGNGVVYLLRATSFRTFVRVLVLTVNSPECNRFELSPVVITRVVDTAPAGRTRVVGRASESPGGSTRVPCPYEDDRRPDPKKWRPKRRGDERRTTTTDRATCREDLSSPCPGYAGGSRR